ncbi:eukaryotic membrane protein family-domain-containing protein [Dendryphion nanum]|uniref:Eukaryotic membrane protein family-domain-containing protein n=1 Tax=Dendryphion nanum TaxID=256645 RepID=A0A9P9IU40_9PLEO|nr:eukaryotic membrane protein family-domain-containing protein [Dendryphion nanum]
MNRTEESKRNGEIRTVEQLPTPSLSPEPWSFSPRTDNHHDDDIKKAGSEDERSKDGGFDGSSSLSVSSNSRRPSVSNDEALLSDTSERTRPHPQIKRPGDGRRRSSVSDHDKMLRLSPKQIHDLTSEPASIPIRAATPIIEDVLEAELGLEGVNEGDPKPLAALEPVAELNGVPPTKVEFNGIQRPPAERRSTVSRSQVQGQKHEKEIVVTKVTTGSDFRPGRPQLSTRAISTPPLIRRKQSSQRYQGQANEIDGEKRSARPVPPPLNLDHRDNSSTAALRPTKHQDHERDTSPLPAVIPLPPFSIPTFLSLELSADRPSPLYIYRPSSTDFPYESSKIKYDRLVNFLFLPPRLEGILGFGAFACLDAWMHILTILPLRFLLAVTILVRWWGHVMLKEVRDLWNFVYSGMGRVWRRRRGNTESQTPTPLLNTPAEEHPPSQSRRPSISIATNSVPVASVREINNPVPNIALPEPRDKRKRSSRYRHRRTKSTPSALLPSHKADILKGLLVISSCALLMRFDASKMYHGIRGQSAIKLYVIYNVLEVCDRLLSAVGQDVLECLFSRETLDRNPDGRSKVLRPFWMFILALVYNVAHATALFYQVITLNVAVNSYSNALLTLLLSNQFVEIKGTVFKKFEKENLFQVTCADIVERFQLWLMLLIIAMRNIVEVGGLSIQSSSGTSLWRAAFGASNSTAPLSASNIIPLSFTILPKWLGQVFSPFFLVLGSEMLVDWLKHAYITKFNQTKPEVYGKFLDVLAKDYYSNAFTDPNLTRRLGLPVLPLACLFIRAAIQTYHMFIATYMPPPLPSTATSLAESTTTSSPATTAALAHIDQLFRRALGRSAFGSGTADQSSWTSWMTWTVDDFIAFATMILVFLAAYLFMLAFKLILGMVLLRIARNRFHGMKERERLNVETGGKRIGGWGVVDVDEDKRRWIYNDDPDSLRNLRERDEKTRKKEEKEREQGTSFGHVSRYAMVAKRIW